MGISNNGTNELIVGKYHSAVDGNVVSMTQHVGLVAGCTGIVGRAILETLNVSEQWHAMGLARRPDPSAGGKLVSVDLTDPVSLRDVLEDLETVTHLFYAAYQVGNTRDDEVAPNLAMLTNLVEAVESVAGGLQRILLMQGSKWYGSHLGPYQTPAREDDPRHPSALFYYDQQDWIVERQQGKSWAWVSLRPHGIWGYAIGSQLNMMNAIAVYATLLKHMGLPLYFPGKSAAYSAIYQMTDAQHLAKASLWAMTSPDTVNQSFNITNGDLIRWKYAWPLIAEWFGMEEGSERPVDLAMFASDKDTMWKDICDTYDL